MPRERPSAEASELGATRLTQSLTFRLVVPLLLTITAVLGGLAYVTYEATREEWTKQAMASAKRTSDLVKRATHYGMLLNRKEDVHHTITELAKSQGMAGIRVYDKKGTIIFSAEPDEIGKTVDLKAEACITCHPDGIASNAGAMEERGRVVSQPNGQGIVGLINPIHNAPECGRPQCHPSPEEKTILGVLDVRMSTAPLNSSLASARRNTAWATLAMVLLVVLCTAIFVHRVVQRPARELYEGTRRIERGDLDTRIEVESDDELGRLGAAFNHMTDTLVRARQQLIDKGDELARMQRQVDHMEKMASLGKLSATVAHELNNPLAGILTYARLVERSIDELELDEELKSELHRYMELVVKESGRCGSIVRNMLLFARPSGIEPREVRVNDIVDRSLMLMQHHLEMGNIGLEVAKTTGDDVIECDENQIQQAVLALLVNAAEAVEAVGGGSISVTTRATNEGVNVAISDTGEGIDPDVMDRIFEPFFSTRDREGGSGLGLAVVYGTVQRHGYDIRVDSKPGEGSTFTLVLAREPQPPPEEPPQT